MAALREAPGQNEPTGRSSIATVHWKQSWRSRAARPAMGTTGLQDEIATAQEDA